MRHRQTEDIEKFFDISDENGYLLTERKALKLCHPFNGSNHGTFQRITLEETEAALKKVSWIDGIAS
ncbi:unnamed protein product [Heligmosomoides polygyrus]|uniref:Pseudouridine synthase n=1 Tax=Heligmosomoides polygyrus TaxID=6339 RepID=A0A183G1Q0_HELPZ|nr:unnamed protein product [Heligmosomoides polygyrus]